MGKHFGQLAKVNHVVFYRLSPHELKPFAGLLSHSPQNLVRRFSGSVLRWAPPFMATYMLYRWGTEANHHLHLKNPKDYENDE